MFCDVGMVCFFFFKQKTAYDMRISDWSSDVCSSDLAVSSVKPGDHVVLSYQACGHCSPCLGGHFSYCDFAMEANFSGERLDGTVGVHSHESADGGRMHGHFFGQSSFATYALTTERNNDKEIGSASCRERVCQYV